MLGSLVYVGGRRWRRRSTSAPPTTARASATSWSASATPADTCPAASFPHAFVELHIEQGPVLEDEGITIGAVTGVQGISWTELTITGQSAHAGTTPMRLRHDPGSRGRAIHERALIAGDDGRHRRWPPSAAIEVHPNLVNVVPSTVSVDRRSAQHRRGGPEAGRAAGLRRVHGVRRRGGRRDRDAHAGPLRAGRVRQRR